MNVVELRGKIVAATSGLLGVYTTPNGSQYPAIIVLPQGSQRPDIYTPTGVECIIRQNPSDRPRSMHCGQTNLNRRWSVFLLQWEASIMQLDAIAIELQKAFEKIQIAPIKYSDKDINKEALEQMLVLIDDVTSVV